ncbi:MAG: IS701 family transposase [Gammaproteobacteria bacterium]|nr:IS701 family transposase [Gammaproteobacteria bacterium]
MRFCESYAAHFQRRTRNVFSQSRQYLRGLMQARKKNMERMAEVVPESDEQVLQHFLTNSDWDERGVLDQVALDADALLGGSEDSALLMDESGFTKKGNKSVGVARQWNGRLGKVDNCQVGVYAALSCGRLSTLIDTRLYLPEQWVKDKARCDAAKVPYRARKAKSKPELALEMVRHARQLGVRFGWVGMDSLYGNTPALLRALADDGEVFVADVHKDQPIYLAAPQPVIPDLPSGRGRKRKRRVAQSEPVRVDQWMEAQPAAAWQRLRLRESTKGKLQVEVLHQRVWVWDGQEAEARHWHLIVRREVKSPEKLKYSLSNASEEISLERLAQMQGQRYWVERSFQDGKSQAGLDHYQVRGWKPWHHHMALVMMAMLFMLKERIEQHEEHPLLSCADIETLLAHFLPRRDVGVDEVIRQMEFRHQKRQAAIDLAYGKQQLE